MTILNYATRKRLSDVVGSIACHNLLRSQMLSDCWHSHLVPLLLFECKAFVIIFAMCGLQKQRFNMKFCVNLDKTFMETTLRQKSSNLDSVSSLFDFNEVVHFEFLCFKVKPSTMTNIKVLQQLSEQISKKCPELWHGSLTMEMYL